MNTDGRVTAPEPEVVQLRGIRVSVRRAGSGDPVLLLHGFPHTKELWREVTPVLVSAGFQVIAPDLQGLGDSDQPEAGYAAHVLAEDQVQLLDALSLEAAHVVGFDLGAASAFAMAAQHPTRVLTLTLMEAVIGGLPGAEEFSRGGGPWWFSFHQAPGGLAESVVEGAEDRYVRFFLELGSRVGVPEDLARQFVQSYLGRTRLRAAFEHYRAMPENARWNSAWAENGVLEMPVTALGASVVKDATARQLGPVSRSFEAHSLPDSGHIIPIDDPAEVARVIVSTARRRRDSDPNNQVPRNTVSS